MRLLTKFWMVTPVGKLEFNRNGVDVWEMYGTKGGFERKTIKLETTERTTSRDVVTEFGWPTHFAPYGEIHEEVPNKVAQPSRSPVEVVKVLKLGDKIYVVLPDGSHEIYSKQQGESNGED